jgi:hypothetical protein
VVALPWFVLMQQRFPGFFDYFVIEQHFRRFSQAGFNNMHPRWFYLVLLPALTLPWSAWLPLALRHRPADAPRALVGLYVWWIVAVVGFFSLPSSKLAGYVLPALAPWCLLIALGVAQRPRALRVTAALGALACLCAVGLLAWKAPHSTRPAAAALAARFVPGDRVVFVDEMFYDLPFYAGLSQPPIVVTDWASPELPQRDNWRKELYDAARFDPARARELLWPIQRLAELDCHSQAVWFAVPPAGVPRLAALPQLTQVHADREIVLMRSPGRRCAAGAG